MIDINEIEEGVLIETNDFNLPIENLVTEIRFKGKDLSEEEVYKLTCNIIGSLYVQGYIDIIKTTYKQTERDLYTPISEKPLTQTELDLILKHPEKWDEMDVLSDLEKYELCITDKGREVKL